MIWKISIHEIRMLALVLISSLCGVIGISKIKTGVMDVIEWELFNLVRRTIVFTVILDWVSLLFMRFVFLISGRVLFYSGRYIADDKTHNRFMYLVLAFVLSMRLMVLRPNLIRILLGWDGLGLVSYALVIYYSNEKSANAGILTILSNRVGDVAILLRIGLIRSLGRWNFFFYRYYLDEDWLLLKVFLIISAITKRAQIPFSAWLPAAMAAPTPVSALVHSSTLVTAGVYLIIRFRAALEGSLVQRWLLIISCLTIFIAGLGANFEYDLKKIIALSTLSQLGVMLRILSLGYADLAFFHLLSHALFKALLFICAGVVIHRVGGYQDIRFMGNLVKFIPLTVSYITISNLALCGFPFIAGFYSKDIILEVAFIRRINFVALILYIMATGLTVIYTIRLIFYSIRGEYNLRSIRNLSDEDYIITNSMRGLGFGAIIGGACLSWVLFPECYMICLRLFIKMIVIIVRVLGGLVGYILNIIRVNFTLKRLRNYGIIAFIGSIWFMPALRTLKLRERRLNSGKYIEKVLDKGWFEFYGGQGLNYLFSNLFYILNRIHLNRVKVFIKVAVITIIVFIVAAF